NRVDVDAVRGEFAGQANGKGVERGLGGGVGHVLARRAGAGGDRADVDDVRGRVAALPAARGLAAQAHGGDEVGGDDALQFVVAERVDRAEAAGDAGVVHQHGDGAERVGGVEDGFGRGRVGDV